MRAQVEKAAELIQAEAATAGLHFEMPDADMALLARGAVDGLLLYAAVDPDQSARYHALVERFFGLVGSLIVADEGADQMS